MLILLSVGLIKFTHKRGENKDRRLSSRLVSCVSFNKLSATALAPASPMLLSLLLLLFLHLTAPLGSACLTQQPNHIWNPTPPQTPTSCSWTQFVSHPTPSSHPSSQPPSIPTPQSLLQLLQTPPQSLIDPSATISISLPIMTPLHQSINKPSLYLIRSHLSLQTPTPTPNKELLCSALHKPQIPSWDKFTHANLHKQTHLLRQYKTLLPLKTLRLIKVHLYCH